MSQSIEKNRFLFEVSWEVCNKVGGIYTVITSKAASVKSHYGENFIEVGPLLSHSESLRSADGEAWTRPIHAFFQERSIQYQVGYWDFSEPTKVVLFNVGQFYSVNDVLYKYWKWFRIDSYGASWDFVEPFLFSLLAGEFISYMQEGALSEVKITAHFHEWMCGGGLLYLKREKPQVSTVFTTHATVLGRAIVSNTQITDFNGISPTFESRRNGVVSKHSLEKTVAMEADSFTTVGAAMDFEAEKVLGIRPDHVVLNGLNLEEYHQVASDHLGIQKNRAKVLAKVNQFIGKELPSNTQIWMSSGRSEFYNKGFDLLLDSLKVLEKSLPDSVPPLVVIIGTCVDNCGVSSLRSNTKGRDMTHGRVLTHQLISTEQDEIIQKLKTLCWNNQDPERRVHVLYSPAKLEGNDGFWDIQYNTLLSTCSLTVFLSLYEPWGYTPHESISLGVPTVTTDCAGFSLWALQHERTLTEKVVEVIPRKNVEYSDSLRHVVEAFLWYLERSTEQQKEIKNRALNLSKNGRLVCVLYRVC